MIEAKFNKLLTNRTNLLTEANCVIFVFINIAFFTWLLHMKPFHILV